MWLCILSGRQLEDTFENAHWTKVKHIQQDYSKTMTDITIIYNNIIYNIIYNDNHRHDNKTAVASCGPGIKAWALHSHSNAAPPATILCLLQHCIIVIIIIIAIAIVMDSYILKAKKFAEPLFQSKEIAEKVRKSGRHFWAIWGNFGPFLDHFGSFWVILRPFWAILGHFWTTLDHFGSF